MTDAAAVPPPQLFLDTAGSRAMSGARVPVLLCTNKSDLGAKCHSQGYIKKKLEQEIQVWCHGEVAGLTVGLQMDRP